MAPRISPHYPPEPLGAEQTIESKVFFKWARAQAYWSDEVDDGRASLEKEEYRVLSKGASGGGFFVPASVEESVTSAARAAGAVAQVAKEYRTASGESFSVPLASTHGTASWLAESASYTPSDEVITQASFGAFKSATKLIASEELTRDSEVEFDDWLTSELGARLGVLQEQAFCVGDGSGKPLGLVHASSPYTVVTAATGSSTIYKAADLQSVFLALPAAYRANASWVVNADDFGKLAGTLDTAGAFVFPSLHQAQPTLFSRPVYISADFPAPAANAKSLVFGDFTLGYGIRRVTEMGLQKQEELHSDSGQVGYKMFARVDGRPLLSDALRILAHSAT
jgi:HK97 family phage major capsid protein